MVVARVVEPEVDEHPVAQVGPVAEVGLQVEHDLVAPGKQGLREAQSTFSIRRSLQDGPLRCAQADADARGRGPGGGVEDMRGKRG